MSGSMNPVDLEAIEREFLAECGPHDYGVPAACRCPTRDYRPAMLSLYAEVISLREELEEVTGDNVELEAESEGHAKAARAYRLILRKLLADLEGLADDLANDPDLQYAPGAIGTLVDAAAVEMNAVGDAGG